MIANWIKEWAIPLSAGATFLLALGAFLAIWQTRKTQEREHKHRLLNEIIEWAIEVDRCTSEVGIWIATVTGTKASDLAIRANLFLKYESVSARSEYVRTIALVLGEDLHSAVKRVTQNLDKVKDLLWERLIREDNKEKQSKQQNYEHLLSKSIKTLIEVASNIKTKNIG